MQLLLRVSVLLTQLNASCKLLTTLRLTTVDSSQEQPAIHDMVALLPADAQHALHVHHGRPG